MARALKVKVYAYDGNLSTTLPSEANWTYIEDKYMFFPTGTAWQGELGIISNTAVNLTVYEQLKTNIPEAELLSGFYNWKNGDITSTFFDLFPQSRDYYPLYPDYSIIYIIYNTNNSIYGYVWCSGGSANYSTFNCFNNNKGYIAQGRNLFGGSRLGLITVNDNIITGYTGVRISPTSHGVNVGLSVLSTTADNDVLAFLNGAEYVDPTADTDPYAAAGDSGPSGPGDGTFDFTSTDIPIPGLPGIGAMSTGFLNLYHPSAAQLRSLASYMWSGSFDPDNFKKLFADPMDAILGLHIIPTISGHPATSSSSLYVGNVDTGLSMPAVTEQYYELDCGTVQIPPKWGAYLDYSPYSKLSLYLPYIGIVPISADDCMRGSIRVKYHVDVLSGTCVAFVYCVSNRGADGHTLYTFTGSCNCECPVTEGQYANALMAGMRVVSGIVSGSAGGVAGMVAGGISEAANAAISMVKPDIGRSGGMGGSAGLMGIQYPYLILTVPRMAKPASQNKYIGYPSFVTLEMGDCVGFTRIEVTHLAGIPATQGELEEIVGLLAEGVIF